MPHGHIFLLGTVGVIPVSFQLEFLVPRALAQKTNKNCTYIINITSSYKYIQHVQTKQWQRRRFYCHPFPFPCTFGSLFRPDFYLGTRASNQPTWLGSGVSAPGFWKPTWNKSSGWSLIDNTTFTSIDIQLHNLISNSIDTSSRLKTQLDIQPTTLLTSDQCPEVEVGGAFTDPIRSRRSCAYNLTFWVYTNTDSKIFLFLATWATDSL